MDFKVPDILVPDWRNPEPEPDRTEAPPAPLPARPMSEQVWELLEGFSGSREIGELMQGLALVDRAIHPDQTFDAEEWRIAAAVMRQGLELRGPTYQPTSGLRTAFEQQIAAALERTRRG